MLKRRKFPVAATLSVIGELFLTAGVVSFLFIGWQLWLNDLVVGEEQRSSAIALVDEWHTPQQPIAPNASNVDYGEPVVATAPRKGKGFATLYVPRFGADYVRAIGETVSLNAVLNNKDLGVGHYEGTQMPGEVGNFAIAAHRTTWGAPFSKIAELRVGDKIYVQTQDGWYTYVFRSQEYVRPSGVGVLEPVPQAPQIAATDRIITMTSCNPKFSAAERIIAYGVFDSWQPASAGMPVDLAELRKAEA